MKKIGVGDLNVTVTSQQLEHQLDGCDPLSCVRYSHSPSIQVYYALKNRLENSSEAWLQEFVSLDGLDSLLDSLGLMTGSKFNGFTDAILQIDCLSCIRAVLNSRVGLDSLVNSTDGIYKLLKGFDLANTLPRKHLMEMISVICVYSKLAYRRLMEALDKYKVFKHLYHRFSFIMNELKAAETIPHKTAVLTLINAIINSTTDRYQRCRIRNEFMGLSLLDVLSFLQREDTDEDLYTQLQVFIEKKHEDEIHSDFTANLDLSSPQDLVDAIQNKIFGGPKMVSFVNVLQDLLAIDVQEKEKSESLWHLLERHTHHLVHGCEDVASLSEMNAESACKALSSAVLAETPKIIRGKNFNFEKVTKRDANKMKTSTDSGYLGCEDKISPPSYTADGGTTFNFGTISPITRLISKQSQECGKHLMIGNRSTNSGNSKNIQRISQYDNSSPVKLPPKYAAPSPKKRRAGPILNSTSALDLCKETKTVLEIKKVPSRTNCFHEIQNCEEKNLVEKNQLCHNRYNYLNYQRNKIAYPAYAMKNLKWIKLKESDIAKFTHCIWANADISKLKIQPDFQQVEEIFKEKTVKIEFNEIPLLCNKTRLSLNLFLNRLEEEPKALVQKLAGDNGQWLPLPFIKHLMDILPEQDEIKHLKYYKGNLLELGQAEQFLLHLSELPNYNILLLGHLRRAEFLVSSSHLKLVLTSMLETSRTILASEGLKEIFMLILRLGNFLNHGQFNGYAAGFKLGSLTRLTDVKSCEPGHNLVHLMASIADSTDEQLLAFLNEIPRLEKAASPSEIKIDFDKMNSNINTFVRQLVTTSPNTRKCFDGFLEEVKCTFRELQGYITELKLQSDRLADYFCESEAFEIQQCFNLLLNFFKQLRLCRQEVQLMRKQKSVVEKHNDAHSQQAKNKHLALKFGLDAAASSSMVEEKKPLVETLLTELHHGNFKPAILLPSQSNSGTSGKNSPKPMPVPKSCSTTPERELNHMDLSGITLMGTPMMNRPHSEIYDGDLTVVALNAAPKVVTSSVKNLQAPPITIYKGPKKEAMNILGTVGTAHVRTHHRSRSDLADSINITQKWIKYQELAQSNANVPLAYPESSMILPTLDLDFGNRKYTYQQPISLITGPTIALPQFNDHSTEDEDDEPGQFIRNGKKGERKSGALANFFNKISKALKQKNSESCTVKKTPGDANSDEGSAKGEKGQQQRVSQFSSPYPARKTWDKENICHDNPGTIAAADKHRKHPTRISNRFKVKSVK